MSAPLTPAAIEALRALTPGAQSTVHFNHAGASLPSAATLQAIQAHLWREATQGPMEAGVASREQTERARLLAARLLNADPGEIALTGGIRPAGAPPSPRCRPGGPATASWSAGTNGAETSRPCGSRRSVPAPRWKPYLPTTAAAWMRRRWKPCWTNGFASSR